MVLIFDSNLEHVANALTKVGLFQRKNNPKFVPSVDLIKYLREFK